MRLGGEVTHREVGWVPGHCALAFVVLYLVVVGVETSLKWAGSKKLVF